jgi:enoyl-CoA hydratase/carnithine racemase
MELPTERDDSLRVDVADRVATLTLNRPASRNALTSGMAAQIRDTVTTLENDDRVDVLLLTGTDPAFCAGVDLTSLATGNLGVDAGVGQGPFPPRTKLIIGAINGAAVTGGLELALNCDFLVASEEARFADTHARVGVMPGWGQTVLLPERVGIARAREMSVTGNFIDAATALAWGLVNRVVAHDELLPVSRRLAADCVATDQRAVRQMLRTYSAVAGTNPADGWKTEADINRRWRLDAFDADKLEGDRAGIIDRGRRQGASAPP